MITGIRMRNWRSHGDTALEFSEGTNALIGAMGSGKTSVLDAICFGLFGTFPSLQAKKIRLEDVISKKPKDQKEAEVEIRFLADNANWSVKRTISRTKSTSAELRKAGTLVEGPQPGKVNEEIGRILKVDYDLFTRAIYSEQNGLDYFLTIPKGARMRKIDELLAIDKFEKARSTVVALINRFNAVTAERQARIGDLEADPALAGIQSLARGIEATETERKGFEQQLATAHDNAEHAARAAVDARARQEAAQKIIAELEGAKAVLNSTEQDIEDLRRILTVEEIESAELTTAQLQQKLAEAASRENMLKGGRESENSKLDDLRAIVAKKAGNISFLEGERIPQLKAAIEAREQIRAELRRAGPKKLQEELQEKSKAIDRARASVQRAELQIEQLQEGLQELAKVGAVCPICDQELSEKKKELIAKRRAENIEKFRTQAERGKSNAYKLTEELAVLENRLAAIKLMDVRLEATADSEQQFKLAQESVAVFRRDLASHEIELRMLEKALKLLETELESSHNSAERLRTALSKREQLATKLIRSKELQQRVNDLNYQKSTIRGWSAAEIEHLENERASAAAAAGSLAAKLDSAVRILSEKRAMLAELEGKKRRLDDLKAELQRMTSLNGQLGLLESALERTQEQLRRNFITAVNQAMNELWGYMYPYKDFTSCRLAIEEGDFVLQLADSTGWIAADGMASGGERAMACLALRMAFALVLAPQLRWLVLDEPTHNLDAQAVEELATTLRDRICEFVDQVFLITHDPALESAVSGHLYKFERDKEKDGNTVAIRMSGPDA